MRWPWQRTRGRHAAPPVPRQSALAAPVDPAERADPVETPVTVPEQKVRLGFQDGTEVALTADDPRADALRAVADVLLDRRPS